MCAWLTLFCVRVLTLGDFGVWIIMDWWIVLFMRVYGFRFHNYGLWINSLWLWFSCVGISDGHSNWVRNGLNGIVIMWWQLYLELWLYIFLLHFRLFSSCAFLIFSVEDSWHDREQALFPLQTRTTLQEKSARHCPWTCLLYTSDAADES